MLTVASLFAGCGGSSLGYRQAGMDVLYACDSDPLARAAYRLNAPGHMVFDRRDVKAVTGARIREACGRVPDVLDASPPCGFYSPAGPSPRRLDSATALLYWEAVRIVGELKPRAFAIENVEGLSTGRARTLALEPFVAALLRHGYDVEWKLLRADWLGVPQRRSRVLVVGVRADLGASAADAIPRQDPGRSPFRAALPDVERVVGPPLYWHRRWLDPPDWPSSMPAPTVTGVGLSLWSPKVLRALLAGGGERRLTSFDALALQGFPPTFDLGDITERQAWGLIGNAVPPPMATAVAEGLARVLGSARG